MRVCSAYLPSLITVTRHPRGPRRLPRAHKVSAGLGAALAQKAARENALVRLVDEPPKTQP